MKKILLLSAVLLGAASASQAGVRFNVGIGLPLPPLPGVIIGRPAPVVVAPPVCVAPPVYYAQPPFVVEPPSIYLGFGPGCHGYRYPYYRSHGWDHRGGWGHSHRGHRW